jgi:hypothetical protein
MASTKITALDELAAADIDDADPFVVVDTSDLLMAPTGTDKKFTWASLKSAIQPEIVTETGTTRSLTAADVGKWIRCTNAAGCAVTFPSATLAANDEIMLEQAGAGQITMVESSTTINRVSTLKSRTQYSVIGLKVISSTVATLIGDTE